jgi:hypothetical protein
MTTAPCKNCTKRHDRCHSHCGDYKKYALEREEELRKRREYFNYEAAKASQVAITKIHRRGKYGKV